MTRINLYPWRAEREEKSKQEYIVLFIAGCILTFLLMLVISWYYSLQIEKQMANNVYINDELIATNKKLREISHIKAQRQAILAGLSVLQQLNRDRNSTIIVLNDIVELINPLVVIDTITRTDHLLKITGYSESNAGVAKFLRSIELSENFNSAELAQIKVIDDVPEDAKQQNTVGFNNFFELKFYQNIGQLPGGEVIPADPNLKKGNPKTNESKTNV